MSSNVSVGGVWVCNEVDIKHGQVEPPQKWEEHIGSAQAFCPCW